MESKQSFFEKKDQKTFTCSLFSGRFVPLSEASGAKVFCFFFSKKKALPSSDGSVSRWAGIGRYRNVLPDNADAPARREIEPRRGLTAVRGLAAWWVVVFHFREAMPGATPDSLRQLAAAGYLAVDLFFILSGYVIALNYAGWFAGGSAGRSHYLRFLALRLSRVYPVHATILAIFPSLPLATLLFSSRHATGALYPGYYLQSVFLTQAWGFADNLRWNVPAWSISTEWFAYLIFPVLAILAAHVCSTALRSFACLVALLAILAGLAIGTSRSGLSDASSIFALLRCVVEFSGGVALCNFGRRSRRHWESVAALLVAATCLAATMICDLPDYWLVPAGFAALVHGLADETGVLAAALRWAPLQWLGVVSYSTYMCHYFLKILVKLTLVRPGIPDTVPFPVYLMAVLAASALLHYGVERPGQRMLRHRFLGRP